MNHRLIILATTALTLMPPSSWALDAAAATYQPAPRAGMLDLPPQAQTQPAPNKNIISAQDSRALTGAGTAVAQGNTQAATNIGIRTGQTKATEALVKSGNVSNGDARALTGAGAALAQGNTQAATNIGIRTGQTKATEALVKSGNVSNGDARALTGAGAALAQGNTQAATNIGIRTGQTKATEALVKSGNVSNGDARALTGAGAALAQGNTQAATNIGIRTGQTKATEALVKSGNVSNGDARALTGAGAALAQGNTQAATNIGIRTGQTKATEALVKSGNVSNGDARALTGAGAALAQGNTQAATNIAVRAGADKLSNATGVPSGITRSLIGGALGGGAGSLFRGRGGEASSATFKQKNDYVAATDDGVVRFGADGKLSSALKNLGFGDASRLTLSPDGLIKTAAGEVAGRMDTKTGQLLDMAGKPIPSNTLAAQRMLGSIGQGAANPLQSVTSVATKASNIPAGFTNSNWDAAARQKAWDALPPAQQASWANEAAIKSGNATGGLSIPAGSNQIVNSAGQVVGRLSPSAISQFADASGRPIAPGSREYEAFKQLATAR